jgi:hypothetical protein
VGGLVVLLFFIVEFGCLALGIVNYLKIRRKMYDAGTPPTSAWGVYRYAYTTMRGSKEMWLMTLGFGFVVTVAILLKLVFPLIALVGAAATR